MITILKKSVSDEKINNLINWLKNKGIKVQASTSNQNTVLGLLGDTSNIDEEQIKAFDIVESVTKIHEPYKNVSKKFHLEYSVVDCGGVKLGNGNFAVIAGPCSIESEEQITEVSKAVKASGATMLRGGAFKPRTSPYDFQGMRADGIELLELAKKKTGLPIVSEIMDASHLPLFENVDVVQVGARNMQNFELLKTLGKTNKTVLLKRGLANTIKELLMSAEYISAGGNTNIILCERGIRTFEPQTRNTLDLSAVPLLHQLTHLPVIVDPSHATGNNSLVRSMSLAAVAAGADGLMIEVHNNPQMALCDGEQSLEPNEFDELMDAVIKMRKLIVELGI